MKRSLGFTIIELMSALVLVIAIIAVAFATKSNLDASSRDIQRKTAVNAFYYGLKEAYYKQNKAYPTSLNKQNLPYIDPKLFEDPDGHAIGQPQSDYSYQAKDCEDGSCQSFDVSVRLEKEAIYKKSSDN